MFVIRWDPTTADLDDCSNEKTNCETYTSGHHNSHQHLVIFLTGCCKGQVQTALITLRTNKTNIIKKDWLLNMQPFWTPIEMNAVWFFLSQCTIDLFFIGLFAVLAYYQHYLPIEKEITLNQVERQQFLQDKCPISFTKSELDLLVGNIWIPGTSETGYCSAGYGPCG